MLRKLRIILAALFFAGITLLFLDITGTLHAWLGWMAKIQFLPAAMALNFTVVAVLAVMTLVFGRVYCSVVCPLGVMQDIISWAHGKTKKKNRFRFGYSPAKNILRYGMLAIFIICLLAGANSFAALLAPYSSYGRIVSNLFAPIYGWGNNLLSWIAERADSYAFYPKEVWLKSLPTFITAALTFIIIFILAWKGGRTYCNTICPVGTVLGMLSRFSLLAPSIDTSKCRNCGLCGRQCKASCIDMKGHKIDGSRCVACMDCLSACKEGAISYTLRYKKGKAGEPGNHGNADENLKSLRSETNDPGHKVKPDIHGNSSGNGQGKEVADKGRRAFIVSSAMVATAAALKAQEMKTDGGLAKIRHADIPDRETPIVPAGAVGLKHFHSRCTACQLCVSACPYNVLRPSSSLMTFMQPEMSYERGYCRPECTRCSQVCPAGAILPINREEKTSVQIGHAVIRLDNCVVNTDNVSCGNCARHCPAGAIRMVRRDPDAQDSLRIPTVNEERCIGCGACENLCPARPLTAIHVEGHLVHRTI